MGSSARRRKVKKKNSIAVIGAVVITAFIFIGLALVAAIGPKIRAEDKIYAVMTATPPVKVVKPKAQPKPKAAEKKQAPKAKAAAKAKEAGHQSNAPHIATATGSGNGPGSGFAAQSGGGGPVGVVPGTGTGKGNGIGNGTKVVTPAPTAPPPKPPAPPPPTPAPQPKPQPVAVPSVTSIVSTDAEPENQVKPVIPDSLRDKAMNASVRAMVEIEPDGTFTVTLRNSSGDPDLDKIALDTLKRWSWKPAMRNGKPVKSFRLVRFDFVVQ